MTASTLVLSVVGASLLGVALLAIPRVMHKLLTAPVHPRR